jgi:hypothetical protein
VPLDASGRLHDPGRVDKGPDQVAVYFDQQRDVDSRVGRALTIDPDLPSRRFDVAGSSNDERQEHREHYDYFLIACHKKLIT